MMDLSRWISLVLAAVYMMLAVYPPMHPAGTRGSVDDALFNGKKAGGVLLLIGLICVRAREVLGDALWVGRGDWSPKPSTGGTIGVLGWPFLTLGSAVPILGAIY
jgi:hypothetical protein